LRGWEVGVAGFDMSGGDPSGCATRELVS